MTAREVNFDGLVGPTHNYAGLARGNIASMRHAGLVANPREAALQGLEKMRALADLGVAQAVLPPHERPCLSLLRGVGFTGDDARVLERAAADAPRLLAAASSAAAMWTANAATVSPSADTADARVHFTPANLVSQLHRSIEAPTTARVLRAIFPAGPRFAHHEPLPATPGLGDEGAANHTRFAGTPGAPGVSLFVFGGDGQAGPQRYPARQARAASEAVARLHGLDPARVVFARQDPKAIDAGVFHNDVIAVGHERLLFAHERAFAEHDAVLERLAGAVPGLDVVEVPERDVPLADAVASYLFNSQIVTTGAGERALVVPESCRRVPSVAAYLARCEAHGAPFARVVYRDVHQSMRNGGGPACLRLRVVLTDEEAAACAPGVWLDADRHGRLADWVRRHYRDRLAPADLADPQLLTESRAALDELTRLLGLGSVYAFQRAGA
ncbi:N-succinylarginine dihydrolase [wastewater metagenome]|uniref:N-succinylarginine dihydrolase n=2 Tax=unclassified sequences TaxID=12908 RepID=A0A5B8RJM7_9ZZZZ|nr:N-succinylarginine dihydrolase [Arhodomonas sp. KWT]QEA07305.1 N-succinylarginine dihydrolase [uncultured organism]